MKAWEISPASNCLLSINSSLDVWKDTQVQFVF